jgi:hypothetical protein
MPSLEQILHIPIFPSTREKTLTASSTHPTWLQRRRAEKLRRELAILEHMDKRLWRKIVLCGSHTIAALAACFFALGYALHVNIGLLPAMVSCVVAAAVIYAVSRYENGMLWLFTTILLVVVCFFVFEDVPTGSMLDLPLPEGLTAKQTRKAERRAKITRAISRRKLRLEKLLAQLT